jgi:hypothetical protein
MHNYLAILNSSELVSIRNKVISGQLMALNDDILENGIVLSEADCKDIAEFRHEVLVETERVEVGLGIVGRIVKEFSDSGYVDRQNFRQDKRRSAGCYRHSGQQRPALGAV